MTHRTLTTALLAATFAVGTAAIASAENKPDPAADPTGTNPIAAVLTSDGDDFDRDSRDFDIVTQAALAVLDAKPESPVKVLTQGEVPLTVFAPDDMAFRILAKDLTGKWIRDEEQLFTALVETVGVDTIEQVLLYHVVPGATVTYRAALGSNGAELNTALEGTTVSVKVRKHWASWGKHHWVRWSWVQLLDNDPDDANPAVRKRVSDLNAGNVQIAHGISRVLRPADL